VKTAVFCLSLLTLLPLSGCRNCDKVEAELRRRETELRETKDELDHAKCMNESLMHQLGSVHSANIGGNPICAEQVTAAAGVVKLTLGRQTGGYREENCADDALQVVLEPRDCDDHAMKVLGTVRIAALEVGKDGVKKPLCAWDLSTVQLGRTWKSGLWGSGYYVILPWKTRPTTEKLRIIAQLVLSDGRIFEADKDVTVRLPRNGAVDPDPLPAPRAVPADGPSLSQSEKRPVSRAVHLGAPR